MVVGVGLMMTGMSEKGRESFVQDFCFPPGGLFVTCWGGSVVSLWGVEEPPLVQTVAMEHSILQTGSETNRLGRGG